MTGIGGKFGPLADGHRSDTILLTQIWIGDQESRTSSCAGVILLGSDMFAHTKATDPLREAVQKQKCTRQHFGTSESKRIVLVMCDLGYTNASCVGDQGKRTQSTFSTDKASAA